MAARFIAAPTTKYLTRLAVGFCILLAGAAAFAQAEGQRVAKVEIEGLAGYRPSQFLPRLKLQPGKPYSSTAVKDDLTYLGQSMRTATVRTEPAGVDAVNVIFTVSEFPRFRKLQVIGNSKVTTERIEGLARLKPGDVLDEKTQSSLLNALRKEYRVIGMPQAKIGLNLIDVPPAPAAERPVPQADLQIQIEEGRQVLCKDVIIQGNQAFTAVRLRMMLDTKGTALGFIKNYYDEATFRQDLVKLRTFYADHGYFDARVERGLFEQEAGKTVATVSPVIQISEGKRYTFGKATVRGVRLFSQADAEEPFKGLEGQPFDGKKFREALDQLNSLYQNHGLLTTEIDPKYDYDVKNQVLNATVEIGEKNRIYVGKIKLVRPAYDVEEDKNWFRRWYGRFAPPVKEETVMREVLLKPGDVYNKQLERDTVRRLARLDVFDNDKLEAYNEPTGEPGVHNMVIKAEEAVTGTIGGGVGYGDITGAFLFGNFTERNLGGEADSFNLQALVGTRNSALTASYLDRHLRGGEDSLLTRFYIQNQLAPGYRARTLGASTEWGRPLTPTWTAYVRPRVEWVDLTPNRGRDTREDLDRAYAVATGRLRAVQDTRWPVSGHYTEGYLQSLGVEAGYAGGALVKLEGSRDQYFPLSNSLTYRVNAFGGLMPWSRDVVPINERYFLGGDTDMRGFKYRGAGYFDAKDKDVPIGGAAKLLVKNELIFPVYDPVSGVLFSDVGLLGKTPFDWQAPRVSAGTGLRFDMKRVQVALDVALPILYQQNDEKRFFHFSLQSQF